MKAKLLLTIIGLAFICGTNVPGFASSVLLQWDPNSEPDMAGYKVHYKAESPVLPLDGVGAVEGAAPLDIKNRTTATISGLDPGRTYYFAVTAYNKAGQESSYSNIVAETIPLPDTMAPSISSFTIPATSTSLTVPITTIRASDNVGVSGYLLTASATTIPSSSYTGWSATPPTSYTFSTGGSKSLYAWAKDGAGNVSNAIGRSVTISLQDSTTPKEGTVTLPVSSTMSLPDLTPFAVTVPIYAGPGQVITVGNTTRNNGKAIAPASTTYYYLSTNSTLDPAAIYLGSRAVPPLAVGATHTGTVNVTLPVSMAIGSWYIIAKADSRRQVTEASETNNTSYKSFLVGPDLTISAVAAPIYADRGRVITVGDTTRNSGKMTAPASTTYYYLSANSTLDAADIYLGSRAVPTLAVGATHTGTVNVTLPASMGIGTSYWYIIAKADGRRHVTEANETNNTWYRRIIISP